MELGVARPWIDLSVALRALIKDTVRLQRAVVEAVGPTLTNDSLSKMLNGRTPMRRHQFDNIVDACLPELPQDEQQKRRQELNDLWSVWEAGPSEEALLPQLAVEAEAPEVWSVGTLRQGEALPNRTLAETWEFYGLREALENVPGRRRPRLYVAAGLTLLCAGSLYSVRGTSWPALVLGLTWLAILAVEIPQHLQRFPLRHVHGTPPEAVRVPGSWRRPGQPEIAWYVGQEDHQGVTAVLRAHHPSTLLSYRPTAGWLRLSKATPGVRVHWAVEDITHGTLLAQGTLGGRTRLVNVDRAGRDFWSLRWDAPQLIGVVLVVGRGGGTAKVSWHAPATLDFTGRLTGTSPAFAWWVILLDGLLRKRAARAYRRNRGPQDRPQVIAERPVPSSEERGRTGTASQGEAPPRRRRVLRTLTFAVASLSAVAATAAGAAVIAPLLRAGPQTWATAVSAALGILVAALAVVAGLMVRSRTRRWILLGLLVLALAGTFTVAFRYADQLPWLRDWGADVARLFRTEDRPVP
ncbi:hypothetical protein [Streptomyces sp. NPDC002082]|uniref:hypothetical protein n=1 Tax=Streptomyces sp. NPDC002082 TaxID=3154772 RepID=UPI00332401C6